MALFIVTHVACLQCSKTVSLLFFRMHLTVYFVGMVRLNSRPALTGTQSALRVVCVGVVFTGSRCVIVRLSSLNGMRPSC